MRTTSARILEHWEMSLLSCGQNIESRLKVLLPDDVGAALMDGVVLCHLANNISPRSVASIHVPSPAVVSALNFETENVCSYSNAVTLHDLKCSSFCSAPLQPKLSMAKCRRNVENFLDACKKIGVPQVSQCPTPPLPSPLPVSLHGKYQYFLVL